ncbi:MAG: glutaredoxin family protein [Dehalococcoidia bacterium]|nr:glutaredoxin family protein [Dehalococcoidia bacterium]
MTLYTRAGCSLCVQARRYLAALEGPLRFTVDEVDIETDDELHRRYLYEIPVVAYEGRDIIATRITANSLEDALREALKA